MGQTEPVRFREIPRNVLPDALDRALGELERISGTRITVVRNLTPDVDRWNGLTFPGQRRIYLDERSGAPLVTVAAHEFAHQLKVDAPGLYAELENEIRRQGNLPAWQRELARRSNGERVDDAAAAEELTADAVGDALSDPAFLDRLAQRNPTVFRRVADTFVR